MHQTFGTVADDEALPIEVRIGAVRRTRAAGKQRRFCACVSALLANEARPLWQSVVAEATIHLSQHSYTLHQGQFLQASGGVGTKVGDLRPPLVLRYSSV